MARSTTNQRRAAAWRDTLNPLRNLPINRVVSLLEDYDQGIFADLQWVFRAIERTDADLIALLERRMSAMQELDWNIRTCPEEKWGYDETLAEEQQAALTEAYDAVGNLTDAIGHLAGAVFRGYAHVQPQEGDWLCLPPWNVVRDGSAGAWKLNEAAQQTSFGTLPDNLVLPPGEWIISETTRPIDRFALPKYIYTRLGEKDWVEFLDIYGIPGGVVVMPPTVPSGKEDDFKEWAEAVAEGGTGAIPNGGSYTANDGPRGINPFKGYLDYWTEKLVLVGTGGKLTMLTQSGSGTLAGNAQADVFRQLARAHGRRISQDLQRQFDRPLLARLFPDQPVLAYFSLETAQAEQTGAEVVPQIVSLKGAGYRIEAEDVEEMTGIPVQEPEPMPTVLATAAPSAPGETPPEEQPEEDTEEKPEEPKPAPIQNRAAPALPAVLESLADDLQPVRTRLAALLEIQDPAILKAKIGEYLTQFGALRKDILTDPGTAAALAEPIAKAMVQGMKNRFDEESHPRDESGQFTVKGSEFGNVFHGGKKKIEAIDPNKLQSRDGGFYGSGFYATKERKLAETYGKTVTEFAFDANANILLSNLDPKQASAGLVETVKKHYIEKRLERARSRGKEESLKFEADHLTSDVLGWKNAVDEFGTDKGFDAIAHSAGEIVIKKHDKVKPVKQTKKKP